MARLAAEGHEVAVQYFTDGETSRVITDYQLVLQRQRNFRAACNILGATPLVGFAFDDQRLDIAPLLDLARHISGVIEDCKPHTIYTHHGGDVNQDHRAVFEATLIATRPHSDSTVREVYCYEVPSSTEWAFGHLPPFVPNVFVNISDEPMRKKLAAAREYKGELRPFPHPRSAEALVDRAHYWGSVAGVEAAEAFMLVRSVR